MVAQRHEEVKEQLSSAVEHFQLHGAAALEGAAGTDDERQVMGSQLGVAVRCVGVRIARGSEYGAALNARLWIVLGNDDVV